MLLVWLDFVSMIVLAVVGLLLTAGVFIYRWHRLSGMSKPPVNGHVHPSFEKVRDTFMENLDSGWERDGAAFAAFYKGELVVDLWGGFADREAERPWARDTLNVAFSATKALGALCVAILVDRGLVSYETPLVSFWPAYGKKQGKAATTVQMAGLYCIDQPISLEDARDHEKMAAYLEEQAPLHEPGTRLAYHVFTYGWLVDQIVRRVDPKRRGIGTFFREEIAQPHGLDVHIGLPLEMAHRVSRLQRCKFWHRVEEFFTDPLNADYFHVFCQVLQNGPLVRVSTNPSWMNSVMRMTLNNPDLYSLEQTAVLGLATARDLARLADLVLHGKIISSSLVQRVSQPIINVVDSVTNALVARGYGLTHVERLFRGTKLTLVGHAGFGGNNIRWDLDNELTFAYLSNGLKGGMGDRARTYVRLVDALYDSLPANNNFETKKLE